MYIEKNNNKNGCDSFDNYQNFGGTTCIVCVLVCVCVYGFCVDVRARTYSIRMMVLVQNGYDWSVYDMFVFV